MAINSPSQVNRTYDPSGATVPSGIRGGRFTLPNNPISPGIELGQVYTSYYRVNNNSTMYTVTVPANSTLYVQMSTLQTSGNSFAIVYSDNGNYIQLTNPMKINVGTSAGSINYEISGYDQYDQRNIYGNNPASPVTSNGLTARCFNKLTAIKLTNVSGTPAPVTISSTFSLELPYFDYGQASLLLNCRNPQRPLLVAPSNVNATPINWDFIYVPSTVGNSAGNPITATINLYSGTPRPIIELSSFEADGGSGNIETIAVRQGVFGFNSLPNWVSVDPFLVPSLINGGQVLNGNPTTPLNQGVGNFYSDSWYSIGITGHPNYDVGWKPWQG